MKSLKLDHELADLVRRGEKTSTWRIYDDKDISVNDLISLIDKVEPQDPSTWVTLGIAKVNAVIEKRLGDITSTDYAGHETFSSPTAMLETYQKYYGPQVARDTPIKMIHFSLLPQQSVIANNIVKNTPDLKELKLYADGGSRGNPGPSASGFALMNMNNNVIVKTGVYLGITTNNQAEYQALKLALEEALKLGAREVHVYMDSLLVINQMLGIFKVKNRDLWPIHNTIEALTRQFHHVSFTHVPRELNKLADAAVNEALNDAERSQKAV